MQIIDLVVGTRNLSLLTPIAVVMGVAVLVMAVLGMLRQLLLADVSDRVDTTLGSQVVGHLFRLPLRFFDRRTVGDLSSRIYDLQKVRHFITDTGVNSVLDMLFMPVVAVVLFWIQPLLAGIVLAQVPLLLVLDRLGNGPGKRLLTRRNRAWSKTQGYLVEVLTAIRTVKSQNFASQARWQWLEQFRNYTIEDYRLSKLRSGIQESGEAITNIFRVILFLAAGAMAVNGHASVGAIFGIYLLSNSIISPILNFSRLSEQYREAKTAMDAVADVLGTPGEETADTANQLPLPRIKGDISFESVSFSYGLNGQQQLKKFDLEIAAGNFVGLVGSSGSGKSTVAQLIDGLYKPTDGRIFIDGTDIGKVQISSLRRQIGFVPQESILFDGTVLDNLRLNQPDAPYDAVVEAAQLACAHGFILGLADGYNTRVGERGGGISGGQKQRIAIARMILQNPSLIVLDEATSALDANTERDLLQNLRSHFARNTLLFVTHRLSTLREADRIILLDQGVVLEDGNWSALMARAGRFALMAAEQQRATPDLNI